MRRSHYGADRTDTMKRDLLEQAIKARDAKRSSVLVRGLKSGARFLIDGNQVFGDVPSTLNGLLEHAKNALNKDGSQAVEFSGETYLIQTLAGPRRLLIIGAVHIAQKLIPMAMIAGYEVQLIDPRTMRTIIKVSRGRSDEKRLRLAESGNMVKPALLNPETEWKAACHRAIGQGK